MAILIKYETKPMRFFGDGEWEIPVDLFLQKKTWFGLKTKIIKHRKTISMFASIRETKAHWDSLIENKTELT